MPRLYVETYGCTANKSDQSLVLGVLKHSGYEQVFSLEDADVVVLLTCVVIDTTEQRMLHRLKTLQNFDGVVVVSGCLASVGKQKIKDVLPKALTIHPRCLAQIDRLLAGKEVFESEKAGGKKCFSGLSAPIAIAEGCRFSCSYCITCIARGRLRSFNQKSILDEVRLAVSSGCKEMLLTAQDTASYGTDSKDSLAGLLDEASKVDGDFRIRVGMMNPRSLLNQYGEVFESFESEKVYKFLHLPVQSGDDDILSRMCRGYTVEEFLCLVSSFRKKFPDSMLSTDIIVGFPGESEKQFSKSVDLIKGVNPDIVNITRFSARQNTRAKSLEGRIPTDVVKDRSKRLTKVCSQVTSNRARSHVGKTFPAMVLEQKESGFWARLDNYKLVFVKDAQVESSFAKVKISDFAPTFLYGRLI